MTSRTVELISALLLVATSLAGCTMSGQMGIRDDVELVADSGCGPFSISSTAPIARETYDPDWAPRSGWPQQPPIFTTGTTVSDLASLRVEGASVLSPSALPVGLTLQAVVLTPADDRTVVRQFFASSPLGDRETLSAFVSRGGMSLSQQPTAGIDAATVGKTIGTDAAPVIKLATIDAALVHGSPLQTGVRPWLLYWSDGGSDFSITGGVSASDLVAAARSIYCAP